MTEAQLNEALKQRGYSGSQIYGFSNDKKVRILNGASAEKPVEQEQVKTAKTMYGGAASSSRSRRAGASKSSATATATKTRSQGISRSVVNVNPGRASKNARQDTRSKKFGGATRSAGVSRSVVTIKPGKKSSKKAGGDSKKSKSKKETPPPSARSSNIEGSASTLIVYDSRGM